MNASEATTTIYPDRTKFTFAFFIYNLLFLTPVLPIMWLMTREKADGLVFWVIPLIVFFLSITSYSYYQLSIDGEKISGASLWGWRWRREEIRFGEMDHEKISRQNLGRSLGIVIIYSRRGKKILTLGLSELQISRLLQSASKQQQTGQTAEPRTV